MTYNAPDTDAGHEKMDQLLKAGRITQEQHDAWIERIQDRRAGGAWGM